MVPFIKETAVSSRPQIPPSNCELWRNGRFPLYFALGYGRNEGDFRTGVLVAWEKIEGRPFSFTIFIIVGEMNTNRELGEPIAYGRTAEIYAWQEGQILKLFYDWFGRESIEYEAQIGQAVHDSGLPVPAVGEIVQVNGRNGLIYERVDGLSMWEVLPQAPRTIFHYARQMAALHVAMHANTVQLDIPAQRQRLVHKINHAKALPDHLRLNILTALESLPDGDRICHGDFHPGNIMVTSHGETIIDWIDASRGSPLADLARSSILVVGAATSQIQNPLQKIFVRIFHAVYLRRYFRLRPGGEEEYRRWLPVVAAARLSEDIPELEQWLLAQAAKGLSC